MIEIEYIIDDTSKEIYLFKVNSGKNKFSIEYAGIFYVYRDDEYDIWGDKWSDHHNKNKLAELNDISINRTGENYNDISPFTYQMYEQEFKEVENRYNPCILKTKHGKRRFSGHYFGGHSEKPIPKISTQEIKKRILKKFEDYVKDETFSSNN